MEIYDYIRAWISGMPEGTIFVRERAFCRFAAETQILLRVEGIADLALWQERALKWEELAPKTVKFIVTGSGASGKNIVEGKLSEIFPHVKFQNDDESDALAVAFSYMVRNDWVPVAFRNKEQEAKKGKPIKKGGIKGEQ